MRRFLTEEQFKLYDLIWKRAVASQARLGRVPGDHGRDRGRAGSGCAATGRVLKFAGFQKLYGLDEEDEESESRLPELAAG